MYEYCFLGVDLAHICLVHCVTNSYFVYICLDFVKKCLYYLSNVGRMFKVSIWDKPCSAARILKARA